MGEQQALRLPSSEADKDKDMMNGCLVPDDLRCKRSDGKQWRCSALSLPDKTVCEKHYIQAKKRAANSALRAALKKARRMQTHIERPVHNAAIHHHHHHDKETQTETETASLLCHQCNSVSAQPPLPCATCNTRAYCLPCISLCYPEIPSHQIAQRCPACCGICTCQHCLQAQHIVKTKVQQIPLILKLKYLHRILLYVLPVVKRIYADHCFEIAVQAKLHGTGTGSKVDIPRAKIDPDQQMLCDFCKVPIFDYHRHCTNCFYDLCLTCCRDIRDASKALHETKETAAINFSELFPSWKASRSGTIPCGPQSSGGCGNSELILRRILKINWISKLAKDTEEMVCGCRVLEQVSSPSCGSGDLVSSPYFALWDEVKQEGLSCFSKYWERGIPVVVRHSFEMHLASSWDPVNIWRGIKETVDDNMDDSLIVKATDCKNQSEVEIELAEFLRGYSDTTMLHSESTHQILRLTGWPSTNILEEFLVCHRPEFLLNFPIIDFIHSKWGVSNLPSKLPHDCSMPEMGPGLSVSYGNSMSNLQVNMCDVVFMLMHSTRLYQHEKTSTLNNHEFEGNGIANGFELERENLVGAVWDVFRREDVLKLNEFLRIHWQEIKSTHQSHAVEHPVYDGAIFVDEDMKVVLKNEYGIQPWSIKQKIGDTIFIPAGCAFQVKNVWSSVQLKFEFLLPESVPEVVRMARDIRCLPNDHHAKLNMLEVEKMCVYAASSAVREIQKISLDPRLNLDNKFRYRNLTQAVSENLSRVSTNKLQVVVNS